MTGTTEQSNGSPIPESVALNQSCTIFKEGKGGCEWERSRWGGSVGRNSVVMRPFPIFVRICSEGVVRGPPGCGALLGLQYHRGSFPRGALLAAVCSLSHTRTLRADKDSLLVAALWQGEEGEGR